MGTEVVFNLCDSWKSIRESCTYRLLFYKINVFYIKAMVTSKINKITVSVLLTLTLVSFTNWEYYVFFKPNIKEYYVDSRVEDDVNDVVKELYKRGVPLHQISKESFSISIDNCMPPFLWGLDEGANIPNKIQISLNEDILHSTEGFRKWVILHEIAHEFKYFHDDTLWIMYPYQENKWDTALDELSRSVLKK